MTRYNDGDREPTFIEMDALDRLTRHDGIARNAIEEALEEMARYAEALSRFKGLADAVSPGYPDDAIIRCEVTAGDVRAMMAALATPCKESNK